MPPELGKLGEAARQPTEDALAEALGALDVLTDSPTRLADLNAVWSWLTKARDLSRAPGSRTANLKPLRDVRGALRSLAPTMAEERWASEEEKAQALADELKRKPPRASLTVSWWPLEGADLRRCVDGR